MWAVYKHIWYVVYSHQDITYLPQYYFTSVVSGGNILKKRWPEYSLAILHALNSVTFSSEYLSSIS